MYLEQSSLWFQYNTVSIGPGTVAISVIMLYSKIYNFDSEITAVKISILLGKHFKFFLPKLYKNMKETKFCFL